MEEAIPSRRSLVNPVDGDLGVQFFLVFYCHDATEPPFSFLKSSLFGAYANIFLPLVLPSMGPRTTLAH